MKRIIRIHKSKSEENCGSPTCAAELIIADKYKVTVKGEPFLLFDSGFGDVNRMILFANQKFFSLLSESETWYADGTFKVVPEYFSSCIPFMQREMDSSTLAYMHYYLIKLVLLTTDFSLNSSKYSHN